MTLAGSQRIPAGAGASTCQLITKDFLTLHHRLCSVFEAAQLVWEIKFALTIAVWWELVGWLSRNTSTHWMGNITKVIVCVRTSPKRSWYCYPNVLLSLKIILEGFENLVIHQNHKNVQYCESYVFTTIQFLICLITSNHTGAQLICTSRQQQIITLFCPLPPSSTVPLT